MSEIFELRHQPELKFIIGEDSFQIIDGYDVGNNGEYPFEIFKNALLNDDRTNWWISIASVVVDLFSGSAVGGKFKDKANLVLETENQKIAIYLMDADFEKAKQVTELLNSKSKI
ncbi:hypothetical protein JCM19314_58 [Nonlabens ulvanivorans]|uniref:Uncharacterized protein n=1 Tax=Nonlabens ulvanivorans TaxID=906888 RepID=A0A090QZH1_NONUL|nr:hypothetical protein [Nonlabens ulvanivorans]GAL00832.1 hypothetical protein JCM19314_58 [Nonlabens ulvanivorans]